jgi:hypothetical protein
MHRNILYPTLIHKFNTYIRIIVKVGIKLHKDINYNFIESIFCNMIAIKLN